MLKKLTPTQKARAIRKAHPSFKAERTLGLTAKEYCALYDVRSGLMMGQFVHVRSRALTPSPRAPNGFNMNYECIVRDTQDKDNPNQCGTVACIGGWMALVIDPHASVGVRENFVRSRAHEWQSSLSKLFYPPSDKNWNLYTPKQAAKAIDAFMGGNVDSPWKGI